MLSAPRCEDTGDRWGRDALAERALRLAREADHPDVMAWTRARQAQWSDPTRAVRLAESGMRLTQDNPAPPNTALPSIDRLVRCREARCWAALEPAKGAELYGSVLRDWPRGWTRDGGLYRARLALACAAAGERDRAEAEGRKALAIARATNSASAKRELRQLDRALGAAA
jgi:hypothetical protein